MKLKLLAAVLLAGAAFSASAGDNSYGLTLGVTTDFEDFGGVLNGAGGVDTITFTGLSSGLYHVVLDYSAIDIKDISVTLNGGTVPVVFATPSGSWSIGGFEVNSNAPFTLVFSGTNLSSPSYSGHIKVSAVPEPATYGMMLGGLGLLGLAARRKSKKQS